MKPEKNHKFVIIIFQKFPNWPIVPVPIRWTERVTLGW